MSTLFNVYVSGISPENKDDADAVKQNTAQMFKLKGSQLEALLDSSQETCVRRKVTEPEAKKFQKIISKLGLVCAYKPIKMTSELSLEPIEKTEEDDDEDIFSCPDCNFRKELNGKPKPIVCESCGFQVLLSEKHQKEQQEREKIRERLLSSNAYQAQLQAKEERKIRERNRQQLLEDEIKRELGLGKEKTTQSKLLQPKIFIPAIISLSLVSVLSFYVSTKDNPLNNNGTFDSSEITQASKDFEAMGSATAEQTAMADSFEAVDDISDFPEQSDAVSAQSSSDMGTSVASASQQGSTTDEFATISTTSSSQAGLADGFNKAEATLNAFGLSTDTIVNSSSGASDSKKNPIINEFAAAESAAPSQTTLPDTFDNTVASTNNSGTFSQYSTANPVKASFKSIKITDTKIKSSSHTLPILLKQLYSGFNNDPEWNRFLSQRINTFIKANKLSEAYKLAINIGNLKTHIDAVGNIAVQLKAQGKGSFAKKLISQLEKKIQPSIKTAPEYLAQVALYQTQIGGSSALFNSAAELVESIKSPLKLIRSKAKIAVYKQQASQKNAGYQYLLEAEQKISDLLASSEKIHALFAIAQSYGDISESEKTEKLIAKAITQIDKISALKTRSELYFQAVRVLLTANLNDQAVDLTSKVELAEYRTLALTALMSSGKTADLFTTTKNTVLSTKSPVNQAIIASTSARKLYNSGLENLSSELFVIADSNLDSITSIEEKDKVLAIIARNYSVTNQFEKSKLYSEQISDPHHKEIVQNGITRLNDFIKKMT